MMSLSHRHVFPICRNLGKKSTYFEDMFISSTFRNQLTDEEYIFPRSQNVTIEIKEIKTVHDMFIIDNAAVYHIGTSCTEGSHEQTELPRSVRSTIRVAEYLTGLPPGEQHDERIHAAIRRARDQLERRGNGTAGGKKKEELGYGE